MKQNLSILLVLATAFSVAAQNKKAVKPVQTYTVANKKVTVYTTAENLSTVSVKPKP